MSGKPTTEERVTSRQRCLERLRNAVILREQDVSEGLAVSINSSMTMTLSELPEVMSDAVQSQVIDVELMTRLNSSKTINWCRAVRPMYPLRVTDSATESRDSLLVAMTTAMWGCADAEVIDRVRRLLHVAMTQHDKLARLAERCGEDESDVVVSQVLTRQSDDDVTRVNSAKWKRVSVVFSEDGEHLQSRDNVRPIHVFVLSNVIRRPVVVVSQHKHTSDVADDLCGIYLPVLHAPTVCCRSPLVVVHVGRQFVPLLPRAGSRQDSGGLQTEPGVPLWRADADEPLIVRCLLSTESAELALTTYLRVVELPYTSATSTGLYPVAKYDVIAPDINILDGFLIPAATERAVLPEAEVVGRYTTVLEQMTAGAAVRVSQPSLGDLEYRRCQTAGCQFYALQQHNWKCSRCYVNESNSSQSASSTAGHVQQLTSHTTAQPLLQEHEPRWNGGLTRRGLTSSGLTTAVTCSVPSCDEPVCVDSELYCIQHASRTRSTSQRTQSQPVSTLCATSHCSRPASDKYAGFCASCYVTAAVNSRVAVATEQVLQHQVGGSQRAPSCIMDFCSNVGSAECKGLCQQCFSAVCQTRLQTAADPPSSTAITSTAHRTGSGRTMQAQASVKCMMEGCRTMVPAESEVCDVCRRKQMEAYEDVIRGYH